MTACVKNYDIKDSEIQEEKILLWKKYDNHKNVT